MAKSIHQYFVPLSLFRSACASTVNIVEKSPLNMAYNDRAQLTDLEYRNALDQVFIQYHETYDPAGQLIQETYNGQTSTFTYDPIGQLIAAMRTDGPNESFSWDANGNPNSAGYAIGLANQIRTDGTFNYFGSSRFLVGDFQSFGSMQVRIFRRR